MGDRVYFRDEGQKPITEISDSQFLLWLRDRIVHQYREVGDSDIVMRLEYIAGYIREMENAGGED